MSRFYDKIPEEQIQALTAAVTAEVMYELHLPRDCSSRLYGAIETAIIHELSKEKN